MRKSTTITGLFILGELVLGTLLSELYIDQYSFWTSLQDVGQFFATIILIYCVMVFLPGALHLIIANLYENSNLIRCVTTSLIFGTIFALPILLLPLRVIDDLNPLELSPSFFVLPGLVTGFNFQLLKISSGKQHV